MSLLLETRNLTKRFGACTSVSDVSLSFEPGLIHAVLGENGAGKSTLMKLLFGLHQPTEGEILLGGEVVRWRSSMDAIRHGLGMVQQHFTLVEPLSAIDNVMLGAEVASIGRLDRKRAIAKIESVLPSRHLAVPWETPVADLSVGQRQRVEILKLLFRDSKILFLDEPTAVLAPSEIEDFFEVLRQLKAQGRTIVLITHKINEVLQVCDTYSILRQSRLITRGPVAGASVESIVEAMIGRKLPEFEFERRAPRAETVLETRELREEPGVSGRLEGVSMRVQAGEVVGIAAVEGSGQTNLVDVVMGLRDFTGDLRVLNEAVAPHATARVRELGTGLVPEDRHHQGLWLEQSCRNNMVIGLEDHFISGGVFDGAKIARETTAWAQPFDVRAAWLDVPVVVSAGAISRR